MNKYPTFLTWKHQEQNWLKNPQFKKIAAELEPEYQLARSLIAKRLSKGFTQAELAKLAKTSQSAIARAESGEHTISLSFLKKLAHALEGQLQISIS